MKKIVGGMLILLLSVAIFAADKTIITTRDKLEKILEKNKTSSYIQCEVTLENNVSNTFKIENFKSSVIVFDNNSVNLPYNLSYLNERLNFSGGNTHEVTFILKEVTTEKKKIYQIVNIDGIESYTEYVLRKEREANFNNGLGKLTDAECESEKIENEKKGYGLFTNFQLDTQRQYNEENRLGKLTDAECETERTENEKKGYGLFTNFQLDAQRQHNDENGLGRLTDAECETERKENERAGKGLYTNLEYERMVYENKVNEYKKKVNEHILRNEWFSAMLTYLESYKLDKERGVRKEQSEVYGNFLEIKNAIKLGKPGLGEYDDFSLYSSWKQLLKDSEKCITEYSPYDFEIGKLEKKSTNFETQTYDYEVSISKSDSTVMKLIKWVKDGLKAARNSAWKEIPDEWPFVSVYSTYKNEDKTCIGQIYRKRKNMQENGAFLVEAYQDSQKKLDELNKRIQSAKEMADYYYGMERRGFEASIKNSIEEYNSAVDKINISGIKKVVGIPLQPASLFGYGFGGTRDFITLYDIKLNIVDKDGSILVKGTRQLIQSRNYKFESVNKDISAKIQNGDAHVVVDSIYLNYGVIDGDLVSTENRIFLKSLPDVKIDLTKVEFN